MKATAILSAVASLLSLATAATAESPFKPPQVWKNANLVHIISLEKNYVKENINVLVENVDNRPHDEYYVPFTADQLSRLGGVEVKDRKDPTVGPFGAELVEVKESDTQYLRIRLPEPVAPGAQQTLGISYYLLKAYTPLPASIRQEEQQYLRYTFSAYCPSAYMTAKQKTEVKFPSGNIADFTKLPGAGDVKEFPQRQGSKLVYGPFDSQPAYASQPVTVRFEFNKPVTHVSRLERDIEVSHWGGNVAFEERYTLHHRGANLSALFNRVKWQQAQFYAPTQTWALKELKFPLRAGSVDAYYTDVIGNVSTSRFRSNKREAVLEIRPRYPVFGGWKYPFTIGWNSDAKNFLRRTGTTSYVLNVPFLEGPRTVEGVEYGEVQVRVILPEGAENVRFLTPIPLTSLYSAEISLHRTYLDTIGRTALVLRARNLVDDFRDRELIVAYDVPLTAVLRKPAVVFASGVAVFVAAWLVGRVELKFDAPSGKGKK